VDGFNHFDAKGFGRITGHRTPYFVICSFSISLAPFVYMNNH